MRKILLLYFSGAGSTKKIAELMAESLNRDLETKTMLVPVENADNIELNQYDAFIFGTPVYHGAPAKILMDFVKQMAILDPPKPAFLFNSRGLGSYHTNRILAKKLLKKGIITLYDKEYSSPASDGSLIVPFFSRFFKFEKNLDGKIVKDCMAFLSILKEKDATSKSYIPRLRFSSVINAPKKLAGHLITFPIYLHKNRCTKCSQCIDRCPYKALIKDASGFPVLQKGSCAKCYRCIHHCPAKALSLSKRHPPDKVLRF